MLSYTVYRVNTKGNSVWEVRYICLCGGKVKVMLYFCRQEETHIQHNNYDKAHNTMDAQPRVVRRGETECKGRYQAGP